MPATSSACTVFAPTTLRELKRRSGISGFATRDWRRTKTTSSAAASTSPAIVRGSTQPHSVICRIVKTPSISAAVTRAAPGKSAPCSSPSPSGLSTRRSASQPTSTPIGRLMTKMKCQEIAWVRTPPSSRPIEPPAEATKP